MKKKKTKQFCIIKKYKAIFVHIPKTAGISIKSIMDIKHNSGHHRLTEGLIKSYPKAWKEYFKFTFVRNPWDRIVSGFFFMFLRIRNRLKLDKPLNSRMKTFDYCGDFKAFIRDLPHKIDDVFLVNYFTPQTAWLFDRNDKPYPFDLVGKVETINEDFEALKTALNLSKDIVLPHHNKSTHKPYYRYYDDNMVEIVYNIYKKEIEYLEYKFGKDR